MSKAKNLIEKLEPMFEMANIRKTTTGLPVNIWVYPNTESGHKGLRIKVSNTYSDSFNPKQTFSLYFDGEDVKIVGDINEIKTNDINSVIVFFKTHKKTFELFWNMQIDDDELKRLLAKSKKMIEKLNLWEMTNLKPKTTGLPMVIWIKPKTTERHSPRITVQTEHGDKVKEGAWVSISIEDEPQMFGHGLSNNDFKLVSQFIKKYKEGLLQVWNDEIEPADFNEILKRGK